MGSIPTRAHESLMFLLPGSSDEPKRSDECSTTQHAMPLKFFGKWRAEVSKCERSVLTLGSQVPFAAVYIKI